MDLEFQQVTELDILDLTRVMTRSFDDDAQRHLGVEKGGPEGYDNGGFFRQWLLPYDESVGYKIMSQGRVIGGFIVWIFEHGRNRLGTMFIDPDYQDQGVGTRAWEFIEQTYANSSSWTLGTPSWAVKNHYFYQQKCGFRKIGEEDIAPDTVVFIYEKDVS